MSNEASIRSEVEAVMALAAKATPGEWRWSVNGNIVTDAPRADGSDPEIAAVYTEHGDDSEPANSAAICALLNLFRTHGPALLAKLEDAENFAWLIAEWNKPKGGANAAVLEAFRGGDPAEVRAEIRTAIKAARAAENGDG